MFHAAARLLAMISATFALALAVGCQPRGDGRVQGYVEGEFVYIASPHAGALETLAVQRGAQVNAGDLLFTLESAAEKAARDESERRVLQARANFEDQKKGKRPEEIDAVQAQL